jgi:putative peptidoglycan lipid II flippase
LARYGRSGIKDAGFQETLAGALAAAILMVAPLTVGAILLREPIVRLLFARGAFDEAGVALTATALLWYAPQLPFVAIDQLLIAAFYAVQDTRVPVLAGVASAVIFAAVAVVAAPAMGMSGLVGANTVQHAVHATILAVVLKRRGFVPAADRLGALVRAVVAGAVMGVVITVVQSSLPATSGTVGLILYLMATGGAGVTAYVATLATLRGPEVAWFIGRFAAYQRQYWLTDSEARIDQRRRRMWR